MLAKVMPFVGHAATRARGTVGGSLANADPAAEIALVAVTLGATLTYREGRAATDTIGRAGGRPPREPTKGRLEKSKTPPSSATMR